MVKKNGRRRGRQRYLCLSCGYSWQNQRHVLKLQHRLWDQYVFKRQTLDNLAERFKLSTKHIRRELKLVPIKPPSVTASRLNEPVALVCDTTYFGSYGVMVWRCFNRRRNLLWHFVVEESVVMYLVGIKELEAKGYTIASVTCDGHKGLLWALARAGYKTQLCQFHMMKTVTRYLTRRPLLPAGQELRSIMLSLPRATCETFSIQLSQWLAAWAGFLKDRTIDPETGHWQYTHRRIRAAYRSLTYNLPYLFTFEKYPDLNLPKTTNTLDGTFSHLKQKVRIHRGLNLNTQRKMIETILAQPSKPIN